MQEHYDDSYDNLPPDQKAFIDGIRYQPHRASQDIYHRKLSTITQGISEPVDKLNFYTSLSAFVGVDSKMRYRLMNDLLQLGLTCEKDPNLLHVAAEAFVLGGMLSPPGCTEHTLILDSLKKLVESKQLVLPDQINALDFITTTPGDKKDIEHYSKTWIELLNAIDDKETHDAVIDALLIEKKKYPSVIVTYLSESLRDKIARNPQDETIPEAMTYMIRHTQSHSEMEAYWCNYYHHYQIRNGGEEGFDYSGSGQALYDLNDEFSYSEHLREIYSNLDMLVPIWSERSGRDPDDALKIQNKVAEILKMDETARISALISCGQNALDAEEKTEKENVIFYAEVIDSVISQWPVPVTQEPQTPGEKFQTLLKNRLSIIGKFTDAETESAVVSVMMRNKKDTYISLRNYMHIDSIADNPDITENPTLLKGQTKNNFKRIDDYLGHFN